MKIEEYKQMARVYLAQLPFFGNEEKAALEAKKLKMANVNTQIISETFRFFRWYNQWQQTDNLIGLMKYLDGEEAELFDTDLGKLDVSNHA